MSQIIGNPAVGIGGNLYGTGVNGPLVHLWGNGDPNTLTDPSIYTASVGSLFSRLPKQTKAAMNHFENALCAERALEVKSEDVTETVN